MNDHSYFKTRLRNKGQITVPIEIRDILAAEEGDDLLFTIDENGRVIIEKALLIPADQAWFWSERWQRMERRAQLDIEEQKVFDFESGNEALEFLQKASGGSDAEAAPDE